MTTICVNCKHYRHEPELEKAPHRCCSGEAIMFHRGDPVTGEVKHVSVDCYSINCGECKFFEDKNEPPVARFDVVQDIAEREAAAMDEESRAERLARVAKRQENHVLTDYGGKPRVVNAVTVESIREFCERQWTAAESDVAACGDNFELAEFYRGRRSGFRSVIRFIEDGK